MSNKSLANIHRHSYTCVFAICSATAELNENKGMGNPYIYLAVCYKQH